MLNPKPPIYALATPHGQSGVAIIRLSGQKSQLANVLNLSWPSQKPCALTKLKPRQQSYVHLRDSQTQDLIDDVLLCYFEAPHSYTGECVVEIACHGNPLIIQKIYAMLDRAGCLLAQPGEFTYRAYLNAKMDLTRAEGIAELIHAQTDKQLAAARQLANGVLGTLIDDLHRRMLKALAYVESSIDFPEEHDLADTTRQSIIQTLVDVADQCRRLSSRYQSGRAALKGLQVAIIGLPNVGKSTLLNRLLEEERAIVSAVPGTTRDFVRESFRIHGRLFQFIDTAGLRETSDIVEKLGIERTLEQAKSADLLILLLSPDQEPTLQDELVQQWMNKCNVLMVANKSDLGSVSTAVTFSLAHGDDKSLEDFKTYLCSQHDRLTFGVETEAFIANPRHHLAIHKAIPLMDEAISLLSTTSDFELVAFEIRQACDALAEIIGRIEPDDVLGKIFSDFCIGK